MTSQPATLIQETLKNLQHLYGKSANVTNKLSEALQVLNQAEDAGNNFVESFMKGQSLMQDDHSKLNTDDPIDKGQILFVTVKSTINSDGIFWCRVWSTNGNYEDNILDDISKELGWMDKEMTATRIKPNKQNVPMFFYSEGQSKYCRIFVEKELERSVIVRYIDIGSTEEVSKETHFYTVPKSNLKEFSFQAIQGCLSIGQDAKIPYEIRWRFNDLTHNQVLMAKVTDLKTINESRCYSLALKSLVNDVDIADVIVKRLKEIEDEKKENEKYKVKQVEKNYEEKLTKTVDDDSVKKPMIAAVEPLKQNTKNQNERQVEEDTVINNSTVLQTISETVQEKLHLVRDRNTSYCSESDMSETPSRCNSLDCIVSAKSNKDKMKSLKSKKRTKSNGHSSDTEITIKKQGSKDTGRNNKQSVIQESDPEDWLEQFSIEERRKVPRVIPSLQNVFYSATKLRRDPWGEIELMNINKLLNSEANLRFYCCDVSIRCVEESLLNSELDLHIRNDEARMIEQNSKNYSQYLVLRNYKKVSIQDARNSKSHRRLKNDKNRFHYERFFILGVARLDSSRPKSNGKFQVTFLSLSLFNTPTPEFEGNQGRSISLLQLSKAKSILQTIKRSLANNNQKPLFPEYFPWCGVPPLIDNLRRPVYYKHESKPPLYRAQSPPEREDQKIHGTSPPQKDVQPECEKKSNVTSSKASDFQEEYWDLEEEDVSPLSRNSAPVDKNKIDEQGTVDKESTTTDVVKKGDECQQNDTTLNSSSPVSFEMEEGKGIFDESGVWYPSMIVKELVRKRSEKYRETNPIFTPNNNDQTAKEEASNVVLNHHNSNTERILAGAVGHIKILQRNKKSSTEEEHSQSRSSAKEDLEDAILSSGERDIKADLLSLVNSTSECSQEDDGLGQEERFEINCQVFNVSSEDFEV